MNRFYLCILWWLISYLGGYGQDVSFSRSHPVTYRELTSPLTPVVLSNDNKNYFIKHAYNTSVHYGGLLSKERIVLAPDLLSFYRESDLFHLDVQRKSALIGKDTARQISYYINSNPQNSRYEGLFATEPYRHRIKRLSLPGFKVSDIHSFCFNASWDVLIFSTRHKEGSGREDLYVSLLDAGKWQPPISLGVSINTEGAEISPFLSGDSKKLFFSSSGHGGYGQGDLFVAERLYDSWQIWSQPTNLGREVNSEGYEAYLSIVGDSLAYFFSETDGQGNLWTARTVNPAQHRAFREANDDRFYLSQQELRTWLGTAIDTTLSFVPDGIELTRDSQELLWFVANHMMTDSGISINVSVFTQPTEDQAKARGIMVRNYLTLLGINPSRVTTQILTNYPASESLEGAVFNFFR